MPVGVDTTGAVAVSAVHGVVHGHDHSSHRGSVAQARTLPQEASVVIIIAACTPGRVEAEREMSLVDGEELFDAIRAEGVDSGCFVSALLICWLGTL